MNKFIENVPAFQRLNSAREIATVSLLRGALVSDLTVGFVYDEKYRILEVHAIGTSTKDGNLLVRGMQVGGDASDELPAWRLFHVDKIHSLEILGRQSSAPRKGYAQDDKQMSTWLAQIAQ